ncbi:unnamed protein product [Cercopithifilaria johnstoni]|uniref:Potassium channel domain-containing protein n=1 Tax=Cercopithifilaria johnstoni TaxID=2874296 RepID=A0A8J2M5B0_9BILA|nr:unnamed protein product [Cercopithifilaria johnstoni]
MKVYNSDSFQYAKLALPHVILVAVTCVYAIAGAWIFYSLESSHEDKLKKIGIQKIDELRKEFIEMLWMKRKELKRTEMDSWTHVVDVKLQIFNEYLYKAFKKHYVSSFYRRKSKHQPKLIRSKKIWTASNAIIFATTTMATIGYGNVVPITSYGRIACIIFTLFGVPLAIITIGDLGKFLSECVVWLNTKMKKCCPSLKCNAELKSKKSNKTMKELSNWDDELDGIEVPLVFAFFIPLFYIAFGGYLFASLEPWSYMDAFYFCFVSITTIGFGDLVPESEKYALLMLIYLGLGLVLTTMCSDLVGIQYKRKFHYFGRNFRDTDIAQLLKRKEMIEDGLTVDQNDEFLKLFLKQLQEGTVSIEESRWHLCNNVLETPTTANYDISDDSNSGGLQCVFNEEIESNEFLNKTNPSEIAGQSRKDEFPAPNSSIFTRTQTSPSSQPSTSSQQQLPTMNSSSISVAFVSPSSRVTGLTCMMEQDSYAGMLNETKKLFSKPENRATEMSLNDSTMGTYENEDYPIEHEQVVSDKYGSFSKLSQPSSSILSSTGRSTQTIRPSKLDLDTCELVESTNTISKILPEEDVQQPIIYYQNIPIHSLHQKTVEMENVLQNLFNAPESIISHKLPPSVVDNNYCFVIDGETIGSDTILHDDIHWSHTSRRTQYFYSNDLRSFHRVNCIKAKGKIIAVKVIGSQRQIFSTLHSIRTTPIHQSQSINSIPPRSVSSISGFHRDTIPLTQVYVVTQIYSFWKTCPSFRRIVTLLDRVNENDAENNDFQKRIFVQHIWHNAKQRDKERVKHEFNRDPARLLRPETNKTSMKLASNNIFSERRKML